MCILQCSSCRLESLQSLQSLLLVLAQRCFWSSNRCFRATGRCRNAKSFLTLRDLLELFGFLQLGHENCTEAFSALLQDLNVRRRVGSDWRWRCRWYWLWLDAKTSGTCLQLLAGRWRSCWSWRCYAKFLRSQFQTLLSCHLGEFHHLLRRFIAWRFSFSWFFWVSWSCRLDNWHGNGDVPFERDRLGGNGRIGGFRRWGLDRASWWLEQLVLCRVEQGLVVFVLQMCEIRVNESDLIKIKQSSTHIQQLVFELRQIQIGRWLERQLQTIDELLLVADSSEAFRLQQFAQLSNLRFIFWWENIGICWR